MQSITTINELDNSEQTFRVGRTAYYVNFLGLTFTPVTVAAILPESQQLVVTLTDGSRSEEVPMFALVAFRHQVPADLKMLTDGYGAY